MIVFDAPDDGAFIGGTAGSGMFPTPGVLGPFAHGPTGEFGSKFVADPLVGSGMEGSGADAVGGIDGAPAGGMAIIDGGGIVG